MEFTFTPFMLLPAAIGLFALIMLVNRKSVIQSHKRSEEKSSLPKAMLPFQNDPSGQLFPVTGVLMLVMSAVAILVIGTGQIEL